ncbi:hypothetical protein B7494_g4534 [Chlorociboria aeruginascens]|nr:hypothetical protein B7494_g4534 [Chlorociboria aeruginascens]
MSKSSQPTPSPYFSERWLEAQRICQERLNPSEYKILESDFDYAAFEQNLSDVRLKLGSSQPVFLQRSSMESLRMFLTLLAVASGTPPLKTAMVWGLLSLVIEATADFRTIMPETIQMINTLGHDLEILQIYGNSAVKPAEMNDDLISIFVDIIMFWTHLLHFLRRTHKESAVIIRWPKIRQHFEDSSMKIRNRSAELKEKFEALKSSQLEEKLDSLTLQQSGQSASLLAEMDGLKGGIQAALSNALQTKESPISLEECKICRHNIPYPKNSAFLSREAELNEVRKHISKAKSQKSFQSFVLWGTGGVGKTQTALAYVYEQVEDGIEVILWIRCETGLSIAQSFMEVAALLELKGHSESNDDRNRFITLQWLRKTGKCHFPLKPGAKMNILILGIYIEVSWLMVLDNLEDKELAKSCWPIATRGAVLVTSRRSIFGIEPAADGLEIDSFKDADGASILLRLVNKTTYDENEIEAARQLSIELGGHALALAVMAAQIVRRTKTIANFLELYKKHRLRLHREQLGIGTYYTGSLYTCWQTTFEELSPQARKLLGVLAFVAPDEIPEALFQPGSPENMSEHLPEALSFLEDELSFDEAISELSSTSLIKRDPITKRASMHRLIQYEFRNYMTASERSETFLSLARLLFEAFPKCTHGQSLRGEWGACQAYIQHALVTCVRWQEYRFSPTYPGEFITFTTLLANCGWYLREVGSWSENLELMNTAFKVCEDKESLLYAHLCNSYGCMESERGLGEVAIPMMLKCLEIREKLLPSDHIELANIYNNYGNTVEQAYLTPDAFQRASDLHKKGYEIYSKLPLAAQDEVMYIPYLSWARSSRMLGDYKNALEYSRIGREYVIKKFGAGSFFDAVCDEHDGAIWYDQEDLKKAKPYYERAYSIFNALNETHPATSSAYLRLAVIEMHDGKIKNAILMLRKALVMAKLCERSKGDRGETARVTRVLADALRTNGDIEEATKLHKSAEAMRLEIQKNRKFQLPDEKLSYDILVWNQYW